MSGLILPDGVEPPKPELVELPPDACIYARRAVTVLDQQTELERTPYEEPNEYAQHLTMARNDLAASCGRLCATGCRVWTSLNTKRIGITLAETQDEQTFTETLITITSLSNHEKEDDIELDRGAQFVKDMVEQRIDLMKKESPDDDKDYTYPSVTDGAYGLLSDVCGVNYKMILGVLDRLWKTSMAQQTEGVAETSRSYPVLLEDPTKITLQEVQLILAYPPYQDMFRMQDTPRSQIFRQASDMD